MSRRMIEPNENPKIMVYADETGEMFPFYDREEIYENCTVQVLTNSRTGAVSIGWWKNEG